ncbi:aspartic peptidase domain-containing protein [Limtongia smithiae]|uniref:aspartic peptidase domain-containing protein n=1 Tax=Limtongia smithiae TaxID=1125753 RepID=UPI0034CE073A
MTSSDFWVESTTSVHGTAFDAEKSQSYFTKDALVFKDCVASSDILRVGLAEFAIDFAHCVPPRASVRTLRPSGGMLGLAHSCLTQTGVPQFFEASATSAADGADGAVSRATENRLGELMFSVEYKPEDPAGGAYLALGGMPHQVEEALYAPVKTTGFWQILFKTMLLDGNGVVDNIQGVIDVNCPFVLAPPEDVHSFYSAISGAQPLSNGFWSYPCFEDPKIHIEHAGWLFPFKDNNLGKVKEASGYCVGPIVEADLAGLWVIGEPFLRGTLSVFDYKKKRVGFRSVG